MTKKITSKQMTNGTCLKQKTTTKDLLKDYPLDGNPFASILIMVARIMMFNNNDNVPDTLKWNGSLKIPGKKFANNRKESNEPYNNLSRVVVRFVK